MNKIVVCCGFLGLAAATQAALPERIVCEGAYPYHLQGVATDESHVYWSFTTVLVKTDLAGHVLATNAVEHGHMGDLCWHKGKVYVGVNNGGGGGRVGDEVWQFDAATLKLDRKIPTPQTVFCNNGVEWCDGFFYVVGAAPNYSLYNVVHVYTEDWRYRGCRFIDSGWTFWGVQTIARIGDKLVFGYYGNPKDEKMPHEHGAFFVDAKRLAFGNAHAEYSEVVPCAGRLPGSFGEGIVELGGRSWRAWSFQKPMPKGSKHKSWCSGGMSRYPELDAHKGRGEWKELWRDDFSGTNIDERVWSRIGKGGADWNRHMSKRTDLVEVRDGKLVLRGKRNDDLGADPRPFLTGGIWTRGKKGFPMGKIELRAKFEDQKGAWPAFWTYGYEDLSEKCQWPRRGEIDIIERLNADPFVYQTAHSAWTATEGNKRNPPQGGQGAFKPGEYNVFAVEVATNAVIWSVNGQETFRYPRTDAAPTQWPFECPQMLILDMQLAGAWVGDVDVSTLPVAAYVDWVRYLVRE